MDLRRFTMPRMTRRVVSSVIIGIVVCVTAVCAVLFRGVERPRDERSRLLRMLPAPDTGVAYVVVDSRADSFPSSIFESAAAMPQASSALLHVMATAQESAATAEVRDGGVYLYGAVALRRADIRALSSGALPPEWRAHIKDASIESDDVGGLVITSPRLHSPIYVDVDDDDETALMAATRDDIERLRGVRTGRVAELAHRWRAEDGCDGRALICDGGAISQAVGAKQPSPLEIELRWRAIGAPREGRALSDESPTAAIEWYADGMGAILGDGFMRSLRARDWSSDEFFIPEPLIVAAGLDLPDPGRRIEDLPGPIRAAAEMLSRMSLRQSDVRELMTGPSVLSLGGRTQVLWFDLPGLALDIQGRGDAAKALVDRFWAEAFFGVTPRRQPGWSSGGAIELPFSVTAEAEDGRAVLGVIAPDAEQNTEIREMLALERDSVGWLFVDAPKLGAALAEMPTFNALLNADEGLPMDEEVTAVICDSLSRLGRLYVSFASASSGSALWYD